jgi:hypothetical protein
VFVAVVSGLPDDLIVGVATAVRNAEEEGDIVAIPVNDKEEEIEDVNVFCKEVVTVAVAE